MERLERSCSCKKGYCIHCKKCTNCACSCGAIRRRPRKRRKRGEYTEEPSSGGASEDDEISKPFHLCQLLKLLVMKEETFKSIPGKKKRKLMAFTDFSAQE